MLDIPLDILSFSKILSIKKLECSQITVVKLKLLALKRQLAIDIDGRNKNRDSMAPMTTETKSEWGRNQKNIQELAEIEDEMLLEGLYKSPEKPGKAQNIEKMSKPGHTYFNQKPLRMADINRHLDRERFGAKFEVQDVIAGYGEKEGMKLINNISPKLAEFRREFPEMRDLNTIKYSDYSAPTKTWKG